MWPGQPSRRVVGVPRHGGRALVTRGGVAADGSPLAAPRCGLRQVDEGIEGVAPGNEREAGAHCAAMSVMGRRSLVAR
jgi:hypothetical protein